MCKINQPQSECRGVARINKFNFFLKPDLPDILASLNEKSLTPLSGLIKFHRPMPNFSHLIKVIYLNTVFLQ